METNSKNIFDFFFKFFFSIFPFLLISGPFLPDLFISIISLYFIAYYTINKKIFFFQKNLIIFFIIFYLYININSVFSFIPLISFSTTAPYIRMILFSIFIAYLLHNIINLKKIIFYSFLLSYLILFFDSLLQLKMGQNILGYSTINFRISSLFGSKLIMGSYAVRVLPILIAITYFENFKHSDLLRFLCISFAGALVFFSAERVSLFYYIMTVVVYLILLPNKKQMFVCISFLFLLFVGLSLAKPSSVKRIYQHSLEQISEKKSNSKNIFSIFSYRHELHFITAYKMFIDKIFIGHGVKSFRYLCDDSRYSVINKIKDDNKFFAPMSGYLFIGSAEGYPAFYIVPIEKKQKFEILFERLSITNANKEMHSIYAKEFKNFALNNSIYSTIVKKSLLEVNFQHLDFVKKGDYLISRNDYRNGCNTHPHSAHLQILSELGLVGYLFVFSFFVYLAGLFICAMFNLIFKKGLKSQKSNNLYFVFILLSLIQDLFPILPSGNIFNNWLSAVFYFKLAFLFNHLYYNKKSYK